MPPLFSRPPDESSKVREELISRVIGSAKGAVDEFLAELKKQAPDIAIDNNAKFAMFTDFAYLHFHWVGIAAFNAIGAASNTLMVALHHEFIAKYGNLVINKELPKKGRTIVQQSLSENLLNFRATFAEYPIRPKARGAMAGTLFYEFGKVIAEEVGTPNDMRVIGIATIQAAASVKSLDANSLISRLKTDSLDVNKMT